MEYEITGIDLEKRDIFIDGRCLRHGELLDFGIHISDVDGRTHCWMGRDGKTVETQLRVHSCFKWFCRADVYTIDESWEFYPLAVRAVTPKWVHQLSIHRRYDDSLVITDPCGLIFAAIGPPLWCWYVTDKEPNRDLRILHRTAIDL